MFFFTLCDFTSFLELSLSWNFSPQWQDYTELLVLTGIYHLSWQSTLICSNQWVPSRFVSQWTSSIVGKQMSFSLRKLNKIIIKNSIITFFENTSQETTLNNVFYPFWQLYESIVFVWPCMAQFFKNLFQDIANYVQDKCEFCLQVNLYFPIKPSVQISNPPVLMLNNLVIQRSIYPVV